MKRRTFMASAGTVAAASTFPAPAIAQGIRELKLVSSWPADPRDAQLVSFITESSGGRLRVKFYPVGELFDSFEVFDAVSEGIADMYLSVEAWGQARSPAFYFFNTAPFGLSASEMTTWIYEGGGQELWDELSANFNIKPFLVGNNGVEMGGWYTKEMISAEDFKGLRIRIAGLGGEVLRRLGAVPVLLAPSDILPAVRSGALDAAEFVGPFDDLALELHKIGKYYYYPGVHQPGTAQSLGINRKLWDSLSAEEQSLIRTATVARNCSFLAATDAANMRALVVLLDQHSVQLRKFNDEILRAFGKASGEVVAEIGARDPFTRRVYESYMKFREASRRWVDISERAYLNARELDFPYGT